MSKINIDSAIVQNEVSLNHSEEKLVEISNGCICRSLYENLLLEVNKLARARRFDCLVIESTGICEPLPVAETFTFADERGVSLSDVSTMVTVVDAVNFLNDYDEAQSLQDKGEYLGDEDERSVADLLVDQVEFAAVILISKTDLVDAPSLERLTALLKTLNTSDAIIPVQNGQVDLDQVLTTGWFNFAKAQQAPNWLQEMHSQHVPKTEEYGIGSFSCVARKPFHPKKFYSFLHDTKQYGKLIRSTGYFWLATRPEFTGQWGQAGGIAHYGVGGMFWKFVSKENWATDGSYLESIRENWVEALDSCLLSEDELLKGKQFWPTLPDSFPAWRENDAA